MKFRNSCILALLALLQSTAKSATVLPIVGPHRFDVATTSQLLTDSKRLDPFAKDGRQRSIMVSGYYPIKSCDQGRAEPYMPPATAAFQNEKFAVYGLPNGTFDALSLETCNKTAKRKSCSSESLPVVLFSGALGTSRFLYGNMLQSIAAAGYFVLSIDHPYDADVVEFPNGTLIAAANIDSDADVELAVTTRVKDMVFLQQQFANNSAMIKLLPGFPRGRHAPKTAVVGHSLGGAAAAAAMAEMKSVSGGVNIDGTMFGPVLKSGFNRPFMLLGHDNKTQETDPSWKAIWPKLTGWKREFEVKKAAHYSFSDLPIITSSLGLQSKLPPQVGEVLGTIEGRRMAGLTVTYVTAFLDKFLKGDSGSILNGKNKEYPEVVRAE